MTAMPAATWHTITPPEWLALLTDVFGSISAEPRCAPVLRDIGNAIFQVTFRDRPELSYWEQYGDAEVAVHLGRADEPTVEAQTTFPVFIGTLLRDISIMEAAADELWELRGSTETLMRLSNLLPYVMLAFSAAADMRAQYMISATGGADVRI